MNNIDFSSLKPPAGAAIYNIDMNADLTNDDDDDELMDELFALQAEDAGQKPKRTRTRQQMELTSTTAVKNSPFCQQTFVMPEIPKSLLEESTTEDMSDTDMDFLNDSDLLTELNELVGPSLNSEQHQTPATHVHSQHQLMMDIGTKKVENITNKEHEVFSELEVDHTVIVPPIPPRSSSIQMPVVSNEPTPNIKSEVNIEPPPHDSLTNRAQTLLLRRRKLYLDVAKAAKAANDRTAAMEAFEIVKMFNQALDGMKQGVQLTEEDLEQIPPSPKPYLTVSAQKQTTPNNEVRSPVVISTNKSNTQEWMSEELRLVLMRQAEFKKAALAAKQRGDIQAAKEYLIHAHSMDQMVEAAKCGLPIDIQQIPNIPSTSTANISFTTKNEIVDPEILKKCQLLERELLKQIDFCAQNIIQFQSLGDTKNILLYEGLQQKCKKELHQVQLALKGQVPIPQFKLVELTFPKVEINSSLLDDQLQLKVTKIENLKLPPGWKPSDCYLYVFYKFPYPHGEPQTGKTSVVKGTNSPEYTESFQLSINRRTKQLTRICKRVPLKLEIYQKGGFLRSDKLFGHADISLQELEQKATLQGKFEILDGRKKTGAHIFVEIRISKPLADNSPGSEIQTGIKRKWVKLE